MKTILIINEKKCSSAPRLKQAYDALQFDYRLIIAGDSKPEYVSIVSFIDLNKIHEEYYSETSFVTRIFRKVRRIFTSISLLNKSAWQKELLNRINYGSRYKQLEILSKIKVDLIINHHLYSLPLALKVGKKTSCNVIVNAHEYYPDHMTPEQGKAGFYNERMKYICENYLPSTKHIFAVSKGIGQRYKEETEVGYSLVRNDKPFQEIQVKKTSKDKIKLIHHGAAHPLRNIELMIGLMPCLPKTFELHLMLVGPEAYINELKSLAKGKNIYFHQPVPLEEIPKKLNQFDLAIFLFEPITFNLANVLPNKFFEAVQARLGIVTGPSPDMSEIVGEYNLGITFKSFERDQIVSQLSKLSSKDVDEFKMNTDSHSKNLSSEETEIIIKQEVKRLIKK